MLFVYHEQGSMRTDARKTSAIVCFLQQQLARAVAACKRHSAQKPAVFLIIAIGVYTKLLKKSATFDLRADLLIVKACYFILIMVKITYCMCCLH